VVVAAVAVAEVEVPADKRVRIWKFADALSIFAFLVARPVQSSLYGASTATGKGDRGAERAMVPVFAFAYSIVLCTCTGLGA
jgi:hypothetical protein